MKIIFSRKAFDSSYGGIPNAILPDGSLCWFPIPDAYSKHCFKEIIFNNNIISKLLRDLSSSRISPAGGCHIDPDVCATYLSRSKGWRPCFEQAGAAQSHLERNGVGEGDLFLFYGWFRQVTQTKNEEWRYLSNSSDMHVIFGWLQVGQMFHVTDELGRIPKVWREHSHVKEYKRYLKKEMNNTIYVAREKLNLPGLKEDIPGGGGFPRYRKPLCLTAPDSTRGKWLLPEWFIPKGDRPALTYHNDLSRWEKTKNGVTLRTANRGQEFRTSFHKNGPDIM